MEKEIIIPRKRSKSIKAVALMLFATLLMSLCAVLYFMEIPGIKVEMEMPLLLAVLVALCAPCCAFCTIFYWKQIFNTEPVLIVNAVGVQENMSSKSVGMVQWTDIQKINVIPYFDGVMIGVVLKRPEKYIDDPKRLNILKKQKSTAKWGHISISSIYFQKEWKQVVALMKYYFAKYNPENN